MSGIAGFMGRVSCSAEVVRDMATALSHRGPDYEGFWVDEEADVALSHRKLSIRDLSPAVRQPLMSHCRRYVIVMDGEIFNYFELQQELKEDSIASINFRARLEKEMNSHSQTLHQREPKRWHDVLDTEILLDAISDWGIETTLNKCVGTFAFAIWDCETHTLTLARDRIGEKPLYYGWQGDTFLFGSELKALKVHPAFQAKIDRDILVSYFRLGLIPAPYSIYEGINQLLPGTYLPISVHHSDAHNTPIPYWDLSGVAKLGERNTFVGTDLEAVDELERLLIQSVRDRMPAEVSVGAFLSGGIDSTTVTALLQAQSSQPVCTFTVGFEEEGYDESCYARAVAEYLGTDHRELYVTAEQAIRAISRLATLYDEPFSDIAQIPTFLVSELAKRHVKVCLSGDGADCLFGGVELYATASQILRETGWIPYIARLLAAHTLKRVPPYFAYPILRVGCYLKKDAWKNIDPAHIQQRMAAVLPYKSREALYLELTSHCKRPDEIVLEAKEPKTVFTDPSQWVGLRDYEHHMMYIGQRSWIPDGTLVMADRAAMGASLETRAPLMDHRIVEFIWSLPLSMKIRNDNKKWILRQVLYRYIPKEIVERPKMGFDVPVRDWLRGPLKEWAESLLDEKRIREEGFLNPAPIREKWIAHLEGKHDWSSNLWDVLMFQNWLEAQR